MITARYHFACVCWRRFNRIITCLSFGLIIFYSSPPFIIDTFSNIYFLPLQYGLKQHFMDQIELDHVTQVIGYHPSYLEHFLKIQTFIMQGDGPLPYDYRHYLAIIVSIRCVLSFKSREYTRQIFLIIIVTFELKISAKEMIIWSKVAKSKIWNKFYPKNVILCFKFSFVTFSLNFYFETLPTKTFLL